MGKKLIVLAGLWILILSSATYLHAQWMKAYGRDYGDFVPEVIQPTLDGGFIACGFLGSGSQWIAESFFWVLKLSRNGRVQWARSYSMFFFWITPTRDGGYIASGWYGIVKLDSLGKIVWKTEIKKNYFWSVQQTRDRGYIAIAGREGGLDWSKTGHRIYRLSPKGKVRWKREFAIGDHQDILSVRETLDGGYAVIGNTGFYKDGRDFWIMKINRKGRKVWQKVYGGTEIRKARNFDITPDGGFLVLGYTTSYDHSSIHQAIWVTKLRPDGEVVWHRLYEGDNPWPYAICATRDSGCMVVGFQAIGALVLKLDFEGGIEWERSFGDFAEWPDMTDDRAYAVCQANDGGCAVLGISEGLGHTPNPRYTTHNYLVLLKLGEDGSYPKCPYIDDTPSIKMTESHFPMNPLTFGFRKPKTNYIDTDIEVANLRLRKVKDLCAWRK
jgi:hypothetical protein